MWRELIPSQRGSIAGLSRPLALFVPEFLREGSSSGKPDWFGARRRKSSCVGWKDSFPCCAVAGSQVSVAETAGWRSSDTRETRQTQFILESDRECCLPCSFVLSEESPFAPCSSRRLRISGNGPGVAGTSEAKRLCVAQPLRIANGIHGLHGPDVGLASRTDARHVRHHRDIVRYQPRSLASHCGVGCPSWVTSSRRRNCEHGGVVVDAVRVAIHAYVAVREGLRSSLASLASEAPNRATPCD